MRFRTQESIKKKDHNKVVEKTEKQVEEPVFEEDEMDYVIK
jgi:hypothetical protein